jgi:acyl-CoA dehydrogenase
MAWDFQTEPEFQEKLDWADEFVRREVEPLDLAFPDTAAPYDRGTRSTRRSPIR